jgi:hypothetical protein
MYVLPVGKPAARVYILLLFSFYYACYHRVLARAVGTGNCIEQEQL